MSELKLKYDTVRTWNTRKVIENDMRKIKISHHGGADDWYVKQEYGKTVREMWVTLSFEERKQAEMWIKEYESKLTRAIQDYESRKEIRVRPVEMDF